MSIETRVPRYGIVFGIWQVCESLGGGLFRLESLEDSRDICALKVLSVIARDGELSQLTEEQWEEYTALRRQRRKSAEEQLQTRTGCLEYTFLDWEDEEGYGRDLLIRMALPEPAVTPEEPIPEYADAPVPEETTETPDDDSDEEGEEEEGGSNVLLKVLIGALLVATIFVAIVFGKIILTLKGQVDQASLQATVPQVTAEVIPTEALTEAPTEAPTEPPVQLDPTKLVDISIGRCHAAGLYEDGSVDVVYLNDSMRRKYPSWEVWDASAALEWTDITQLCVDTFHMAGLRSDGTVVAIGGNSSGECDVSEWTDIVAIATGQHVTVGLKADGTVVSAGSTLKVGNLSYISDATAINLGSGCLEYLQSDGSWKRRTADGSETTLGVYPEIRAIYCNDADSLGILADGTVVVGRTTRLSKDKLAQWTDIVDIYGNASCLLGLKSDGTVCALGTDNQNYQQNVAHWSGIANLVGPSLAIKEDGSFTLVGTSLFQSFELAPLNRAPAAADGEAGHITGSSSGVNARAYPGINCDIVTRLPAGAQVVILERKTTYDGMVWGRTAYGWVSMDYVALD